MLIRPVSQMISVRVPMMAATIGLPEPAATARWKPRSWRRNTWGSSRAANMPVSSSAIPAMCSPVARSAASAAAPTSSMRRASYIWSRVKPWSAARNSSGALPRCGGPSTMNVPAPRREVMMPIACSVRSPDRSEGRLTPIFRASSRSGGRRSPGPRRPASTLLADVLDDLGAGGGVGRLRAGPIPGAFAGQDAMTNTTPGSTASNGIGRPARAAQVRTERLDGPR